MRMRIGYPPPHVETRLMLEAERDRVTSVPVVLDPQSLVELQRDVDRVSVDGALGAYLQALISATRSTPALALGASTRAGMNLSRAARARALLHGSPLLHRRRHPRSRRPAPRPPRAPGRPRGGLRSDPRRSRVRGPRRRGARPGSALEVAVVAARLATHPRRQRPLEDPAGARGIWGKLRRWFRPPRKLKLTREGKYFIGITFGVGFAAINTGNNLLYLLLGMLLSLIVVSGVMSELSLRHLTVVRRLPPRAQVGRAHLVEIEVYNHKQRIPSYAIEIEDLRAGQPADKRCFFLKISPRSAQVAAYRRTPARRGTRSTHRLSRRDPLSLRVVREVARAQRGRRSHHLPRGGPGAPAH